MGYFEFPHTRTYDSDLGWLITEYKRISEELAALTERVNRNEEDIEQLKADVIAIREEIIAFKREVLQMFEDLKTEFEHKFDELEAELRAEMARFEREILQLISELEARMQVKFDALEARVNETLEAFREELTQTEEELRAELAQAIADMTYALETGLADIRRELEAFETNINNTLNLYDEKIARNLELAKAYTDEREAYLQSEIDEIRIDPTPRVIIPATLEESTIQNTFDVEHYYLRAWTLRASYYDSLGYTAADYDAEQLLAYDYDYLAKWFLVEKKDVGYMYSPFNGAFERVQTVIGEISEAFRDFIGSALTAAEYDALDLTATYYDSLEIKAFDYDYYSKLILT